MFYNAACSVHDNDDYDNDNDNDDRYFLCIWRVIICCYLLRLALAMLVKLLKFAIS